MVSKILEIFNTLFKLSYYVEPNCGVVVAAIMRWWKLLPLFGTSHKTWNDAILNHYLDLGWTVNLCRSELGFHSTSSHVPNVLATRQAGKCHNSLK